MFSKFRKKISISLVICYLIAGLFALACFIPLWITFSVSISNEQEILKKGYSIIPIMPTLDTYRYLVSNKGLMILRSFGISFATVILGTLYSLTVTTCFSYAVSQKKSVFRFSDTLSFFAWFATVFSGGVLPWYILTTKYYHLQNSLAALFIPSAMSVFYMFILRSGFKSLPAELIEAAKIDGASNLRVFVVIAIPLAKVELVTITLFYALQYWNDFNLSLYLITKTPLYPLQKLLYLMMTNIGALTSGAAEISAGSAAIQIPTVTSRMAMTIITILPVLIFYPFAQKYFVKGMTIGAIKG